MQHLNDCYESFVLKVFNEMSRLLINLPFLCVSECRNVRDKPLICAIVTQMCSSMRVQWKLVNYANVLEYESSRFSIYRCPTSVNEMGETRCNQKGRWFSTAFVSTRSSPKKDGLSIRPTVDFRNLNSQCITQIYPISSIQEALASLAGNSMYSVVDAHNAYLSI